MTTNAVQTPTPNQITASTYPQKETHMARTAARIEKELSRLEEIRDRLAQEEADAARELAVLSAEMVTAMAADSLSQADEIERKAQIADGKRIGAARRRDAVQQAISLTKDELEAVRAGDAVKAARRRLDAGEQRFEAGRRELFEALKTASTALGEMRSGHREASQAADELVDLGEERPGLYAFDPAWSGIAIQRLRDEAVTAALVAAQAAAPDFALDFRIGAAVPTAA